jgi:hypothetical protein
MLSAKTRPVLGQPMGSACTTRETSNEAAMAKVSPILTNIFAAANFATVICDGTTFDGTTFERRSIFADQKPESGGKPTMPFAREGSAVFFILNQLRNFHDSLAKFDISTRSLL